MMLSAWLFAVVAVAAPGAAERIEAGPPPVQAMVVGVRATNTGRDEKYCDPRLNPMRAQLFRLPYDTFEQAASTRRTLPFNAEASFPLTAPYTLFITPLDRAADGRIRLRARVEMTSREDRRKRVNAVNSVTMVVPGDRVQIRGLPLEGGELVVFLSVGAQSR